MIYADNCHRCGRIYQHDVPDMFVGSPSEAAIRTNGVCPDCEPLVQREAEEKEQAESMEAERRRRAETVSTRIEESGLNCYELAFDPGFPGANTKLMSWLFGHVDYSVWVYGPTGRGKTRTIQAAAREAVKDRSVRYWPVYDLAARLTQTSKSPEAQLFDVYNADLLILDDLGVANMTAARLTALTAIVDRRYIGWDQVRRRQHGETARFDLFSLCRRRSLGGQIWITSQIPPEELVAELATVNSNDAAALVRRLAEMCIVHEAEANR